MARPQPQGGKSRTSTGKEDAKIRHDAVQKTTKGDDSKLKNMPGAGAALQRGLRENA